MADRPYDKRHRLFHPPGAGGTWSAFAANGLPLELAPIPGTHALWGAGSKLATTNGSAVIWAYGTV